MGKVIYEAQNTGMTKESIRVKKHKHDSKTDNIHTFTLPQDLSIREHNIMVVLSENTIYIELTYLKKALSTIIILFIQNKP